MGHYCRICGRVRANERFSGHGHRTHVCKDCQRLPREHRDVIEETRVAPPWIARPCDCGSGRSFRDCCLERENEQIDAEVRDPSSLPDQRFEDGPPE